MKSYLQKKMKRMMNKYKVCLKLTISLYVILLIYELASIRGRTLDLLILCSPSKILSCLF